MNHLLIKNALITGLHGQDGSYLAEHLLSLGYEVYGLVRRSTQKRAPIDSRIRLIEGDMSDEVSLRSAIEESAPDEIYNLAAQSHIVSSNKAPLVTMDVNGLGVQRLLQAIVDINPRIRFYQAGTSEMFGGLDSNASSEATRFHPRSPYGCAKVFAHHTVVHYRERFGLHASNGILFNHESPRRGEEFVTRKITRALGRMKVGLQDKLILGNVDAYRDWGFAGDYVKAMHLMLQQPEGGDYVVGTGKTYSVRTFLHTAMGLLAPIEGQIITQSDSMARTTDVHHLRADPSLAERVLGWKPETTFSQLVRMMVESDYALAKKEASSP